MGDHQAERGWELHTGGDESIFGINGHWDECVDCLQRLKEVKRLEMVNLIMKRDETSEK